MDFNNFYISGNGNECPLQLQVSYLLIYFTCDVNMTSLSLSPSWHWWAATVSAACVARLGAVADWWRSWPMANTLACLCSCTLCWWTFWTYPVTVNLFSLYVIIIIIITMVFTDHWHTAMTTTCWWTNTTLDAVGNIIRVHYESMKCDVTFYFHKVA